MSQIDWVIGQLMRYGRVSKEKALKEGITRLPSYINRLKGMGYSFYVVRDKDTFYVLK